MTSVAVTLEALETQETGVPNTDLLPIHRALAEQIDQVRDASGRLDLAGLARLVSADYRELDALRLREAQAQRQRAEEITEAGLRQDHLLDALQVQNTRFEAALDNMSQGLSMFGADRSIVICNARFHTMWGESGPSVVPGGAGLGCFRLANHLGGSPDSIAMLAEEYERLVSSPVRARMKVELADARTVTIAHEPMPEGGYVQTFEDITARRQADEKIAHLATHDVLTDLPNRTLLQQRIDRMLNPSGVIGPFAVLCLDLDRFKPVNDAMGHPAGDALLRAVAHRLRQQVRGSDMVARIGGDEFAIVLDSGASQTEVEQIAERIVREIGRPFEIDGQKVVIGVSVGIATAPYDGRDPVQLLKNADMALYTAKLQGRGCFRLFQREMDVAAQTRRSMEIDLRQAIGSEEFQVHYQPLIKVESNAICGFEALLRWTCPKRGAVSPVEFINLAEELNLIDRLGEWVLRRACQDAAGWPGELKLAVNVSPKQFLANNLLAIVTAALEDSGLAPQRLELEVTESLLLDKDANTLQTLHSLRQMGVRIVMDDFGTGYSSLSYLSSFPFDKIKIDRSFIDGLGQRTDSIAIVRAVTGLCRSLGITSLAEGVETAEQLRLLAGEACTEVQGFLFSKARPIAEVPELLARFSTTAG